MFVAGIIVRQRNAQFCFLIFNKSLAGKACKGTLLAVERIRARDCESSCCALYRCSRLHTIMRTPSNIADYLIACQWDRVLVYLLADTKEIERKASGELRPPPIGNASEGAFWVPQHTLCF